MKMKQNGYSKIRTLFIVMMCLIIGTIGTTSAFAADSDIPAKGWDRLIGGSHTDELNGVVTTSDGGFVAVGSTVDNPKNLQDVTTGDTDGMLVKTDNRGTTSWTKFVGGTGNDVLNSVVTLSDGSILAAGTSTSSASGDIQDTNSGDKDGLLVKYNANGLLQWTKLIGGSKIDIFYDVIPTADNGFLAVGYSNSSATGDIIDNNNGYNTYDGYIVKFDSSGNIQWDNLFGSPQYDTFYSVIQTSDGGFVAAGYAGAGVMGNFSGGEITDLPSTSQLIPHDGLVVKFDASGTMVWNQLFGSSSFDNFNGITGTADGGFVVVGNTGALNGDVTTGEFSGNRTALAVKFNSAGTAQWNRAFAGGGSSNSLRNVVETPTGNFVTAGELMGGASKGSSDGFVANLSASGSVISYTNVGGAGADMFYALTMDQSGHILAAGISESSQSGTVLSKSNGGQDGLLSYFGQSLYTVTYNENGGTNLSNQVVSYGEHAVVPTSFQKPGYTFAGWYLDEGFIELFSLSAPILQDTSLFAKWYVHITMNNIVPEDRSISGVGEPGLNVIVSLADGTKIETKINPEGKWLANLPKEFVLKSGTKVIAAMYGSKNAGVAVSTAEKAVPVVATSLIVGVATDISPDTGDLELFPVWLLGLFLGLIIMVRVFKGQKVRRRY